MKKILFKRKFNWTLAILILLSIIVTFAPSITSATDGLVPCGHGSDPTGRCTLCDLGLGIWNILEYGYQIAFVIALACVTFAGIMYLVSTGDEKLMTSAKSFIKASLLGFALIFCAWVIVSTILFWMSYNPENRIKSDGWNVYSCV